MGGERVGSVRINNVSDFTQAGDANKGALEGRLASPLQGSFISFSLNTVRVGVKFQIHLNLLLHPH